MTFFRPEPFLTFLTLFKVFDYDKKYLRLLENLQGKHIYMLAYSRRQ